MFVLGLLGWDSGLPMAWVVGFGFDAVFISLCLAFWLELVVFGVVVAFLVLRGLL